MLKKMFLVAMAAVSVSVMAQDNSYGSHAWMDGKTQAEVWRDVRMQADYLQGGDRVTFENMIDRDPGNVVNAYVTGLFCAHRQAQLIRDQIIASRFPDNADIAAYTTTPDQSVMALETEGSLRPLRMVMTSEKKWKDMDYDTAFDVLTADLNSTQRTQLWDWWSCPQNEQERDVLVRLLNIDAMKADEPIYPSLYTHIWWINQ